MQWALTKHWLMLLSQSLVEKPVSMYCQQIWCSLDSNKLKVPDIHLHKWWSVFSELVESPEGSRVHVTSWRCSSFCVLSYSNSYKPGPWLHSFEQHILSPHSPRATPAWESPICPSNGLWFLYSSNWLWPFLSHMQEAYKSNAFVNNISCSS